MLIIAAAAGAVLYWLTRTPAPPILYLYHQRVAGSFAWYVTGVFLAALVVRERDVRGKPAAERVPLSSTVRRFFGLYLEPKRLFRDIRLVHALSACFVVFLSLKNLIPHLNSRLHDYFFAAADRLVCGDICGAELVRLFSVQAAPFFSTSYIYFYPYLGMLLTIMVLQRDEDLARRFSVSFILLWLCSLFLVFLVPTWGPCFFFPELFAGLPYTEAAKLQQELWQMKIELDNNPASPLSLFLISGFPSLHLAVPFFGALYLWGVNRVLSGLSFLYTVVTFGATLYLGWHYLLDNIGALVLAAFFFRSSAAGWCGRS